MIYGLRTNGKKQGLVLTKPAVVYKMLEIVNYHSSCNLQNIKIVEPAAGDGAFAIPIINNLYESSKKYNFNFSTALSNLKFFELDEQMFDQLRENISIRLGQLGYELPENIIVKDDFLISDFEKVNIIIGNPPYVRHENIPERIKSNYRKIFGTFTHRSDLYIAFFEKGLKHLKTDGVLSFICSNRWLKNQYGKRLRDYIINEFNLLEVIDLEGSSPFEEEVIAYPAIINIRNSKDYIKPKYYKIEDVSLLSQFSRDKPHDRVLNTVSSNWFLNLHDEHSYTKYLSTIENQGFKIGIGVATGCDKVFIRNDFPGLVEQELLLPILISRDLKNNDLTWSGNYILNPFDKQGRLIDLIKYPKASDYLNKNSSILKKRHVAKKNSNKWYKTIDKINYQLTYESKIILPDISGNKYIFIDEGKYYPHHNLYYIKGRNKDELTILATILMSKFARNQLLEFGNKMNGGYPRWQSQNLRKLRLPLINAIPDKVKNELITCYQNRDVEKINTLITPEKISEFKITTGQTVLFEHDENRTYALNVSKSIKT
jgi:adenine-specific DNA-methyltransferase